MAKHYALWPSRYSDCTDPEKLNLMPFVDEEVTNLGELLSFLKVNHHQPKNAMFLCRNVSQ